jgi:hypothetical protein
VLTINTSWSSTCRMAAALVAEPGEGVFPGPDALLDYGQERLRERAKLGFRAATVVSATHCLLAEGAIDTAGEGHPSASATTISSASRASAPTPQHIAGCFCTISRGSQSIPR